MSAQSGPHHHHPQQVQPPQVPQAPGEHPAVAELRNFLTNAPRLWTSPSDPPVRKFKMANGEEISCVFWKGRFFITGTDVVKILIFRFQQLGRGILNPKKFEEGVFSDLRNLKPGTEAVLEEPRSEFLEFLHKHGCIRTQKKQKVFFWNKVPHDDLFREALERNLKRVATAVNWTQMMSNSDMAKQYMMLQAAANMGGAPAATMLSPGGAGAGLMPALAMLPPTAAIPNGASAGAGGFAPSLVEPIHQMMMPPSAQPMLPQMRHPRRTISMSAVDFTPKPTSVSGGNGNILLTPTHTTIPDISSTLSSPLFTGSPSLDIEIDDKYFDLPVASGDAPSASLEVNTATSATTSDAPNNTISPALLMDEGMTSSSSLPSSPALASTGTGTGTTTTATPEASTPALLAPNPLDHFNNPNDLCILDPTLGLDMPTDDLFSSPLWAGANSAPTSLDKSGLASSGNNPLWDDLTLLIPNVAPNHPNG